MNFLAIYHHRHGEDYALFDHPPSEQEMLAYWNDDFEPDREDEWFESKEILTVQTVE